MKKTFTFFVLLMLIYGCKSPITITSSIKETVIPGRPTEKAYTNYVVNFNIQNETLVTIDSIKVHQLTNCFSTNFLLKKSNDASYLEEISEKGNYTLEIPLRANYIVKTETCNSEKEEVVIYYQENGNHKEISVSEFKNIKRTMR